jgi:hypothetical protein
VECIETTSRSKKTRKFSFHVVFPHLNVRERERERERERKRKKEKEKEREK